MSGNGLTVGCSAWSARREGGAEKHTASGEEDEVWSQTREVSECQGISEDPEEIQDQPTKDKDPHRVRVLFNHLSPPGTKENAGQSEQADIVEELCLPPVACSCYTTCQPYTGSRLMPRRCSSSPPRT